MRSVRLLSLSAKLLEEPSDELDVDLNIEPRLAASEGLNGTCCLEVSVAAAGGGKGAPTFGLSLEACVAGDFEADQELEERLWKEFAECQAVYLLWPYVRELVSNVTVRMDLPPLCLPVLNIPSQSQRGGPDSPQS